MAMIPKTDNIVTGEATAQQDSHSLLEEMLLRFGRKFKFTSPIQTICKTLSYV